MTIQNLISYFESLEQDCEFSITTKSVKVKILVGHALQQISLIKKVIDLNIDCEILSEEGIILFDRKNLE